MFTPRFWVVMVVFQVLFGLTVFALTRDYYQREPAWRPSPAVSPTPGFGSAPPLTGNSVGDSLSGLSMTGIGMSPDQMLSHADDLFSQQEYPAAAQLYQQAIAAGLEDAALYNNLGLTLHYLGQSDQALTTLGQGAALDPAYQRIWLTLGFVNSSLGNEPEARAALARAMEIDADNDVGRSAAQMLEALP